MNRPVFNVSNWTAAPLHMIGEEHLPVPASMVFEALTNPALMCRTFPWMHNVEINNYTANVFGLGSTRRCHFGNGLVLEERIVGWVPPCGYAYRSTDFNHPFGMRGHVGTVDIVPTANGCVLTMKHYFDHSNPAAMRDKLQESMQAAVRNLAVLQV